MTVRLTRRALSEAERKQSWWRENAARYLFDDELTEAIEQVTARLALSA